MPYLKEIIKVIEDAKKSNGSFSNQEILAILIAAKSKGNESPIVEQASNTMDISRTKTLTSREEQIFSMIGNSKSSNTIALELGLSLSTIETHRKNIRKKLILRGKGKLFEYALLVNLTSNAK